jgi:PadR family transcriptional regulator, regulatory protein PadR
VRGIHPLGNLVSPANRENPHGGERHGGRRHKKARVEAAIKTAELKFDIRSTQVYHAFRNRMKKTKLDYDDTVVDRDLYSGLMRLHLLHHAAEGPIFGFGMLEELGRHGYRISSGTLYPLLHGLEKKGYIRARELRKGKSLRKVYRATPLGRKALAAAKVKVREFIGELFEGEL